MDKCYQCGAPLPALGDCPKCHASRRPTRIPGLLEKDLQLDRRGGVRRGPPALVEGPTYVGPIPNEDERTRPPLGPIDVATQPSYLRMHDLPTQPGYIRMEKPTAPPPAGLPRPLARPPPSPQRPPAGSATPQRGGLPPAPDRPIATSPPRPAATSPAPSPSKQSVPLPRAAFSPAAIPSAPLPQRPLPAGPSATGPNPISARAPAFPSPSPSGTIPIPTRAASPVSSAPFAPPPPPAGITPSFRAPPPPPPPSRTVTEPGYDPAAEATTLDGNHPVPLPASPSTRTPPSFVPDESVTDPLHEHAQEFVFHSPPPPPVLVVGAVAPPAPKPYVPPLIAPAIETLPDPVPMPASRPTPAFSLEFPDEASDRSSRPMPNSDWSDLLPASSPSAAASPDNQSPEVLAEPASLWRRLLAFTVDLMVVGSVVALYLVVAAAITGGGKRGHVAGLSALDQLMVRLHSLEKALLPGAVLAVVVALAYTAAFGMLWQGRTLGRKLLGIRLVDQTGQPPTAVRSVVRALLSVASVGLFLGGLWLALFDRRGQTLHDKLTSTFVVRPI